MALKARQLTAEPAEESFSPLGWLLRLRRQTIEQLNALGEGESAALVAAMLTADTADLPAGLRTALSRAGISHLLAVSGLHLSILLAVCGKLGDLLLWSRKRKALYSGLCCLTMIVLAGFSASVLRAALMAGLALGAPLRGRRGDGLTGLGFAAAILLLCNPAAVWELSFLLSCGATLGILLLARPLARLWPAARRSRWAACCGKAPAFHWRRSWAPCPSRRSASAICPHTACFKPWCCRWCMASWCSPSSPSLPAAGCGGLSLYRCQVLCAAA